MQQASTSAGAGPPQQPDPTFAATRAALQTPVSGRTSRTSRAAAWSPAISATTERTCSYPVAAEIETVDGSLVERLVVDRFTGDFARTGE
jgi:hypothetical protein